MKKLQYALAISLIALLWCHQGMAQGRINLENSAYSIFIPEKLSKRSNIEVQRLGAEAVEKRISLHFTVFYAENNPRFMHGFIREGNTPVAAWGERENINFWEQGESTEMHARTAESVDAQTVRFGFQGTERFMLSATMHLPEGDGVPEISWEITPKMDGWFSVAFTGLSPQKPADLDFLYQPLVWTWKRFPAEAVLTPEAFANTAASFTNANGATEGLAVHLKEIPFRYAFFENSLFGVALRGPKGMAKPAIAAPILGGKGSEMKAGQQHRFTLQYFIEPGDWQTGVDYLYQQVLDYKNERQNATVSLNQTLENMIDFAMDEVYGGWVAELKGNDYRFDVPGTVKNVSALHPLSVALTTGNEEIYQRRALPMIEYMMSRQKYLYATSDTIVSQNPSHFLEGPAMEIAELVSLHEMTGAQNEAFLKETKRIFGKPRQLNLKTATGGESWQDYLAKYRLEENPADLKTSIEKADAYLQLTTDNYPEDFSTNSGLTDAQATFATDYANRWQDLLELYEETSKQRFLEAAYVGAKQYLLWTRSHPTAPDSTIVANEGGNVPGVFPGRRYKANSYEWQEFDTSTDIPEQKVPAWHTSLVGLPPEAPYTYRHGPIMLNHQAAPLLRLAHLMDDELMRDVAYNGILGRYANFPGYYFTSLKTTVYQQPDYPLHNYLDIKYNALFYNHIWPHIALLQDFLVSDAYYRSNGQIDFPSAYAPGYAFLMSKVYGHQAGKVFDNENVKLWLPKNALQSANVSLNHVMGRDDKNTYLVLMNTASKTASPQLYLNPDVLNWDYGKEYPLTIYQADGTATKGTLLNGKLSVGVPAQGLVAIKIEGLKSIVPLQEKVLTEKASANSQGYFRETYEQEAIGTVTGMLIGLVPEYVDAYLYTNATEKQATSATLHYSIGEGEWEKLEDKAYPFEFSIRNETPEKPMTLKLETVGMDGATHQTKAFQLKR